MADQLLYLDPKVLQPAHDNPRKNVEVDAEFVASVKTLGVVEPIIVMHNYQRRDIDSAGVDYGLLTIEYLIVAGHRRAAAAVKAKLESVPVIVRELTEIERQETMLVENLHRTDLDPIEEASGYFRLRELGMKPKDMAAKVGRSLAHVNARLSLLVLPTEVLGQVSAGKITLTDAQALSKVTDPKLQLTLATKAADGKIPGYSSVEKEVKAAQQKAKRKAATEKRREELRAEGHTVATSSSTSKLKALSREWGSLDFGAAQVTKHAKEPCHIIVVTVSEGYANSDYTERPYCQDPARHDPDGKSKLKSPEAKKLAERSAEKEKRDMDRQLAEANKAPRLEWITAFLAAKHSDRDLLTHTAAVIGKGLRRQVPELLGLADTDALVAFIEAKPSNILLALIADAYIDAQNWNGIDAHVGAWMEANGYQPIVDPVSYQLRERAKLDLELAALITTHKVDNDTADDLRNDFGGMESLDEARAFVQAVADQLAVADWGDDDDENELDDELLAAAV